MALIYLVNKLQVSRRIARWLLFLEYEFTIVYKPSRTHVVVDVLSRLPNSLKPLGVPDQTVDASLFFIKPIWMQEVKNYLKTCQMAKILNLTQKQKLCGHGTKFLCGPNLRLFVFVFNKQMAFGFCFQNECRKKLCGKIANTIQRQVIEVKRRARETQRTVEVCKQFAFAIQVVRKESTISFSCSFFFFFLEIFSYFQV